MPGFLKQSTAAQARALGPFVSDTDFKTVQTGLTIANTDIKLVVNGGASANKNSGGGTHRANGVYGVTFDATDTATVGEMEVSVNVAGALVVFDKFIVVEEVIYDSLFGASALGYQVPIWATAGSTVNLSATTVNLTNTATTVTNQLTAAAIATGVWQDATAGDFTTANSIGKALYINNIVPGASGGHLISGSNAGTTTFGALTVTGATTLTGNVAAQAGVNITQSSSNTSALVITGNGTGHGAVITSGSGATGDGMQITAASTNGDGLQLTKTGTGLDLQATTTALVLAKTTNITGFNDIAATAIVSGGAITTSGGAVSTVTTTTTATNVTTVNGLAANVITATSINADAITAAKIATGAIDADALATDAVTEIWAGSTAPTAATIADAVWDEDATGHQTQGTFGQAIGDPVADTNTIYKAVVTDAAGATVGVDIVAVKAETASIQTDTNDLQTQVGTAGAGLTNINLPNQTMDIVGNITGNLSGSVGSVTGAVGSVTGNVGGTINGLTATALADFFDTDSGTTYGSAVAGSVVAEIADNAGGSALTAAAIADAVWDEALAGHLGAGSTGEALNAAGAAGDPWITAIPGVYTAGQAGYIVGTNLNATVSSRATQTSVDTIDGNVDSILVDTAEIGVAGAGLTNINLPNQTMDIIGNITGNLSGSVGSVTGLTASNLDATISSRASAADLATVDTVVDAIKLKTDSLTFTKAGEVDSNIQSVNDVTVTGNGQAGSEWGP